MPSIRDIQFICEEYDIAPSKSRGQNFLIDNNIVDKIIKSAKLEKSDTVLEVGPGFGVLTDRLVDEAGQVIAVELDNKLVDYLEREFDNCSNLKIIHGDILKTNLSKLLDDYKVVANLPYSITSKFLRVFLESSFKPREMVIMIQREVAERIIALPGQMSKLSVMVQFYGQPEILFSVSRKSFWPQPKVDSVVIRIKAKKNQKNINEKKLFQIMRIGFAAKRKQLQNNLVGGLQKNKEEIKNILIDLGFDEKIRAQDLSVTDWIKITEKLDD